jgi:copper chaperone NosL
MEIHVNTVRGVGPNDLANINGLNHYIGMRHIEPDAIPVLRIIPWVVGALIVGAVLVGIIGRRPLLYGWLGAFVIAGIVGMATFWWWEYDYGHNLDMAQAIIKVPGMSYQPPLIGSRQILNFTATSYPAVGGWLAGLAFVLGIGALLAGCTSGPRAIAYGKEECKYCHMLISDARDAAEMVTTKGRVYTYDAIECLVNDYLAQDSAGQTGFSSIWVSDYSRPSTLIPVLDARFLRGAPSASPMGRSLFALGPGADVARFERETGSRATSWKELLETARREHWSTPPQNAVGPELVHAAR